MEQTCESGEGVKDEDRRERRREGGWEGGRVRGKEGERD